MRVILKYCTMLVFLLGTYIRPAKAQILVPEELSVAGDVLLMKNKASKLWLIQALPAIGNNRPISVSYKSGNNWNRLPLLYLAVQANSKGIRVTDIDLYGGRVYISGDFTLSGKARNCLVYFETQNGLWNGDHFFTSIAPPPVVNSLAVLDNALYMGGQFGKVNNTECANLARMDKTTTTPVKILNAIGANGIVNGIESDSTLTSLYIAGTFKNILGKGIYGLVQYKPTDSSISSLSNDSLMVFSMRRAGSKLILWAKRDSIGPKEILIYSNNVISDASGLDSTFEVTSLFGHKGKLYFTGSALLSSSTRQSGMFLVSETNKTERVYPKMNQFWMADSYGDFIHVAGNFTSAFLNTTEGFKLARIDDNFRRFYGRVFYDANSDLKYQIGEPRVGAKDVRVAPFNLLIPVDRHGYFSFIVPKTKIAIIATIDKTPDLISGFSYKFSSDTFTERIVDFPLKFVRSNYSNINVRVTAAAGWACRKDTSELYVIKVSNNGLVVAKPDIKLNFNGKIILIKPFPAPDIIDPGQLTWSQQSLAVGEEKTYLVKLTTPSSDFSDNDQVQFSAGVANVSDDNPADNSDTLTQTVSSGVEMNAKYQYPEASPGDTVSWLQPNAGKVDYIIRFTNNTSDTVRTLVVRDTISTPDYVTYIQETGSSHPFTRYVYTTPSLPEKVIVAYTFSNINLPPNPSGNSEIVNSSGYVGFRLGLTTNLASGTDLRNRASIYLENNAPLLTNTVVAIVASSSVRAIKSAGSLPVYPNPVQDRLYFGRNVEGSVFYLHSLHGQEILKSTVQNNSVQISDSKTAPGTYLWTIITASGEKFQGLIIKN